MTYSLLILGALVLLLILYRYLEHRVSKVAKLQQHQEERISGLEIKDYGQDFRMDAQDKKLDILDTRTVRTLRDVKELGRDIGWGDDKRETQVLKPKPPPDDDGNPT